MRSLPVFHSLFKCLIFFWREHKRFVFIAVPLSLLAGLFEFIGIGLLIPVLALVAGGDPQGSLPSISHVSRFGIDVSAVEILGLLAAAVFIKGILIYSQKRFAAYVALDYDYGLKRTVFAQIVSANWEFMRQLTTGNISNVLLVETTRSRDIFVLGAEFLTACILVCVYVGASLVLFREIFWIVIFLSAPLLILYFVLGRWSERIGRSLASANEAAQHAIYEGLVALKVVKAMSLERAVRSEVHLRVAEVERNWQRAVRISALSTALREPLSVALLITVFAYGLAIGTPIEIVVASCAVVFRLYGQLHNAGETARNIVATYPALKSSREFERRTRKAEEIAGDVQFQTIEDCIECRNLSLSHVPGRKVLDGIDLKVQKGKVTAIIGSSGSGKTTLLDALLGLLRPSKGEISIDGRNLSDFDLRSFRARIGLVLQEPVLFNLSIRDNIRIQQPEATAEDVEAAARVAHADSFIEALPDCYESSVGERGVRLSGGQKQRIALARALLAKPEILILDEATSALDHESERQIKDALRELKGSLTIIVVAHRLSTIEDADVIYRLENGKAVELSQEEFAEMRRIAG